MLHFLKTPPETDLYEATNRPIGKQWERYLAILSLRFRSDHHRSAMCRCMAHARDERTRVSDVCPCPRFTDMPVSEVVSVSVHLWLTLDISSKHINRSDKPLWVLIDQGFWTHEQRSSNRWTLRRKSIRVVPTCKMRPATVVLSHGPS